MSGPTVADLTARHIGKTVSCNGYLGTLNSIEATADERYPIQLRIDETVSWVKLAEPAMVIGDQPTPEPTPTTLPSVEELARRLHRRDCDCPEPDAPDHEVDYRDLAQTALALLPGRSEQVVRVEALRWLAGELCSLTDKQSTSAPIKVAVCDVIEGYAMAIEAQAGGRS